jgi:hypothetical protein
MSLRKTFIIYIYMQITLVCIVSSEFGHSNLLYQNVPFFLMVKERFSCRYVSEMYYFDILKAKI